MSEDALEIHLLADSTGESGVRLARAAVAQFEGQEFRLVRHRRVRTLQALVDALERIAERPAERVAVFFTLVDEELAYLATTFCQQHDLPCADLMTDAMRALEKLSGAAPDQVPLRPVGVEADYWTRIASIDFAVRNDDGIAPGALRECDLCIIGPSRSGKTPLSIYLGYMGYRAANVPIVPGIEPPAELFELDRWRIVGLTMKPERLALIRAERVKAMGVTRMGDGYDDLGQIFDELDAVERLQRQLRCPVLDTTGMALEESAVRVLELVEARAARSGAALRRLPNVDSALPGR